MYVHIDVKRKQIEKLIRFSLHLESKINYLKNVVVKNTMI